MYDTVTTRPQKASDPVSLNLEGAHLGDLASGSDMRRNHAVPALFAMAEASGHEPGCGVEHRKRIPVMRVMAGGSADAAATILALNTAKRNLDWSIERLQQVAATLGAIYAVLPDRRLCARHWLGEQIEQLSETATPQLELTGSGFAGRLLMARTGGPLRTPEVYAMFD